MKNILFLSFVTLSVLFTGCSKHKGAAPPSNDDINDTWKVVSYENLKTQQVFTKSSPESGLAHFSNKPDDIIITLNKSRDTLYLKGHTVTNQVSGAFVLMANDSLHCIGFGGMKMSEPNWGSWFWDAMNSIDGFLFKENMLIFYYHHQDNQDGKWSVTMKHE